MHSRKLPGHLRKDASAQQIYPVQNDNVHKKTSREIPARSIPKAMGFVIENTALGMKRREVLNLLFMLLCSDSFTTELDSKKLKPSGLLKIHLTMT